uniref:Uncharacterized protein n=1 Tax=Anguilla anguilla TaxID=7936 RepID=A0A0E9UR73_ANGAN
MGTDRFCPLKSATTQSTMASGNKSTGYWLSTHKPLDNFLCE